DPATGRTVAHCAAASGDPRTLRAVLAFDQDDAMSKSTDSAGRSLLHSAVETEAAAVSPSAQRHLVVRRLLRLDGKAGQPLTQDADGRTPVDLAVLSGAGPALAVLLGALVTEGKSSEVLSEVRDLEGRGLLHSACLTGRADTVLQLVAMGLSPWQPDAHGLPAVCYAAAAKSPDALHALLNAGTVGGLGLLAARVAEDGATLAHLAAHANRPAALRLLAAAGLPVLTAVDFDGWSPLQLAIAAGAWDAAEALVDEAASQVEAAIAAEADPTVECPAAARLPDMRTPDGRSLLHLAVTAGNSGLVIGILSIARLLSPPASGQSSPPLHPTHVPDPLGWTPLHVALFAGRANLAPPASGHQPVSRTADGLTCLHLAVSGCCLGHGSVDAIQLCQEFWPWQAVTRDNEGAMPIHLASACGCEAAHWRGVFQSVHLTAQGDSPLHLTGSESVARLLSSRMLMKDRIQRNLAGRTPSEEARARGRSEALVELLRELELEA
uniref:ANK_REP_REGION domain-containing protein n=1 Tax=Macrostomum lignano TaxID=282301 RepID=A0A1I8IRH1_9PLAT